MSRPTDYAWKSNSQLRVATHAAPHHLDELVALAMLQVWAERRRVELQVDFLSREQIRQLDLTSYDLLLDIGEKYDPASGRFDHHQSDFRVAAKCTSSLLLAALSGVPWQKDRLIVELTECVNRLDHGHQPLGAHPLLSLSTLLFALGGTRPNRANSERCAQMIHALFVHWLNESHQASRVDEMVSTSVKTANGLLACDDSHGFLGLKTELWNRGFLYYGFAQSNCRYVVTATQDDAGRDRFHFPVEIDGATFIHPRRFMVVFPNREVARAALICLESSREAAV